MKPTVSIIVPVYNAEKFLNRCVDSILGQEYRDFELILVDDGSRDMSGSICDAYAKTDERVVVIHKENSGVSDTRNQGIERAKGTYLQFVDSDDWLTPDATKLMVRAAEEHGCDMVISDFYRVVGDMVSRKGDIESDCVIDREEFASFMMENPADYYYGVLWNKLYRRDLVNRFGIRVDAAKDGFVFPASIPGNRKLGEERSSALQEVISDDGIIVDKYRDRKLLERYLESAALKHDMTMEELSLLLYLKDASHELSRKNLADLMDLSRGDLAVAVQRLSAKKMVEITELPRRRGTERKIRLELLPASEVVIPDLEAAENDYYQAKFGNFTEEEIRQYTLLARKVRENERSILQRG